MVHSEVYTLILEVKQAIINTIVDVEPKTLPSNSKLNLTFTIKNFGNTLLENVTVSIQAPTDFKVVTSPTIDIGSLKAGESKALKLEVETPKVDYRSFRTFSINLEYYDVLGEQYSEVKSLTIILTPKVFEGAVIVDVKPETLKSLSSQKLKVEISNVGLEEVYNLELEVVKLPPLIPSEPLTTFKVRKLPLKGHVYFEIPVYVPEYTGVIDLVFNVQYYDLQGNLYTQEVTEGVEVLPLKTFLELSLKPKTLNSLENEKLFLTIENLGETALTQLKVKLELPQQVIALSKTEFYVKELLPNSKIELPIIVRPSKTTTSINLPVTISLEYTYPQGYKRLESKTLYLELTLPLLK